MPRKRHARITLGIIRRPKEGDLGIKIGAILKIKHSIYPRLPREGGRVGGGWGGGQCRVSGMRGKRLGIIRMQKEGDIGIKRGGGLGGGGGIRKAIGGGLGGSDQEGHWHKL